jgi:hypothetical protein
MSSKHRWSPPPPLKLAEVTFLAGNIEALPEADRLLAGSLIGHAMQRGTLSDKQLRRVARFVSTIKAQRREARAAA